MEVLVAVSPWTILVSLSWLHDLLESLALLLQFIDGLILSLESSLQVTDHSLLYLLKLANLCLMEFFVCQELACPHVVSISNRLVVHVSVVILEIFSIFGTVVIHGGLESLHILVVHLGLVDILSNLVRLLLEEVSGSCILHQDFILMGVDVSFVVGSPLVVQLSLLFLPLHHPSLVSILVTEISFTSLSDLVSEFRVLVGDLDLSLKSSLFVLQLPKPVFHHLSL